MTKRELSALVLAAGKSTRIHPVSGGRPKPLLPVAGRSIIERNLCWLAASGFRRLWINLHYRGDEIRAELGDGERLGLAIEYSEEPEILGTAGALKKLEPFWAERGLVVYGDSLVRFDLDRLLAAHQDHGALVTIALFDQDRHLHTGIAGGRVVLDGNGRVSAFLEGGQGRASSLVNAGVYVCEHALLNHMPPDCFLDFGRDVFPALLAAGEPIQGHVIEDGGYCLGLDTPESFAVGQDLFNSGKIGSP